MNPGSHHPEKSRSVRAYAPTGHRHTAEVIQELGLKDVHLSMTAVELVRVADYQEGYPNGGNGWLRILDFRPTEVRST